MSLVCPKCGEHVSTTIRAETSAIQHIFAFCCCIFGLWLGCCLVPYCMDDLKQVTHSCPSCGATLGTYKGI